MKFGDASSSINMIPCLYLYIPGQRPNVAAAATVRRPQGSIRRGNIHNHNTQSDHCLICNRVRGDRVPSTHYCYTCDTLSCVFCEQCATDIHQVIDLS